ncbi:trypsin-2-like [Sitophilus oryzae]|uniref:Trypsin-2-like n=1 Tax=Sitophilus oryzae TaxID=7048 RepID=A0A6J2YMA5_SITOR|nr:trypsin-2-like [Sitophilus oryzae]
MCRKMIIVKLILVGLAYSQARASIQATECPLALFPNIVPKIGAVLQGGHEADIKYHTYQASIFHLDQQLCSGTILTKSIVLTAAHCVNPMIWVLLSQYSVRVGSNILQEPGQLVGIENYIAHEKYKHGTSFDYDIALVFTRQPLTHHFARPVELPFKNVIYHAGQYATVTGYGTDTSEISIIRPLETLHSIRVPIIENHICESMFRPMGELVTSNFWCAGKEIEGSKDVCQGFTGGPAIIDGYLAGIVLFGADCADVGYPGLYLSVPKFVYWIKKMGGIKEKIPRGDTL